MKERLVHHRCLPDVAAMLTLLGLSLFLMRFLFDWNSSVLASDLSGAWAWFYWFKESLFGFGRFPAWSPLWMGGMPFFGIVPPGGFLLIVPLYLLTNDVPGAYQLGTIIAFSASGLTMYACLRHLSPGRLVPFLGAVIYLALPVHMTSMMFWGHFEILCAYAATPLVLLLTDRWLEGRGQLNLILLAAAVALTLLLQIEYALIFLLFYIPYLVFALAVRRMGPRSLLALVRRSKAGVTVSLLVLLIPFLFYLTVLSQYGQFSSLTPEQVQDGLSVYTLRHFGDPFQDRLAGGLPGYFSMTTADYYAGGVSFVILLGALAAAIVEKGPRRARLLFFLAAGMASLVLSMGVFGPLFPVMRKIIPLLSGMRVPTRFYYIFALCLPVLFGLAAGPLTGLLAGAPRLPAAWRRLAVNVLPVLLVAILMLDLGPYFDFYRHRVLDRDDYDQVRTFLEERLQVDYEQSGEAIARVLLLPDGVEPDRLASITRYDDGGQFTIEVSQSWLTWNQYREAFDYDATVCDRVLLDRESLEFLSDLLSYDYVMTYVHNMPPPSMDPTYLELTGELADTIGTLSSETTGPLVHRGSLETQYYTVNLYRLNREVLGKARFYPSPDCLFIDTADLFASSTLLEIYREISPAVTSAAFLQRIVAAAVDDAFPDATPPNSAAIWRLCRYRGEALLVEDNPAAVQVMEMGAASSSGWMESATGGGLGFPGSGMNLAVKDVGTLRDNYLSFPFVIERDGDWAITMEYFSGSDTGTLEVLVDGERLAVFDTHSRRPSVRNRALNIALLAGQHELRVVGSRSLSYLAPLDESLRVEVGRISLLNLQELPDTVARSRALWGQVAAAATAGSGGSGRVSSIRLSPSGVSLDVEAPQAGIVSVAYYTSPWWRAYVDGGEVDLLRINGVFPGCSVPEGMHRVEFVYDYPSLASITHLAGR